MALIVVIVVVVGLRAWSVPYYALTPGDATPVAPLVKIQGLATDSHRDKIMLTDVYLQSLSAWQYLFMHFQSHVEFVNADQLVDPGIPQSELAAQGYLQMDDSKQAAEVAALRALGWTVPATSTGAVVDGVISPSPAYSVHIHVADRVIGVNGTAVHDSCDLIGIVHSLAPGSPVHLSVERARINAKGDVSYAKATTLTVATARVPQGGLGPAGCPGVRGRNRSWLGLSLEDGLHYALPAKISINTSYIGGPSAGLAMTLTLIDQLSAGSLTGHSAIAATGTIDAQGGVGDVGGVAEKTVAVQNAGVKVFIVPKVEVKVARSAARPGLKIFGVTTLREALKDLRSIGGVAPVSLTKPH